MVEGFQMVFQRLPGYGNAVLDHKRGFNRAESVPLNRIRRVGDFDVVIMLKIGQGFARQWPKTVQVGPLGGDLFSQQVDARVRHACGGATWNR